MLKLLEVTKLKKYHIWPINLNQTQNECSTRKTRRANTDLAPRELYFANETNMLNIKKKIIDLSTVNENNFLKFFTRD